MTAPAAGVDASLPLLAEYLVAGPLFGGYKHLGTCQGWNLVLVPAGVAAGVAEVEQLPLPLGAEPLGGDCTYQEIGCAAGPGAVLAGADAAVGVVDAMDVGLFATGVGYGAWIENADVDDEGAFVAVDGFECMAKGAAPVSLGFEVDGEAVVEGAIGDQRTMNFWNAQMMVAELAHGCAEWTAKWCETPPEEDTKSATVESLPAAVADRAVAARGSCAELQ